MDAAGRGAYNQGVADWQLEHINHAIHPEAHPPEYVWHKYWARKPHNVVRQFIEHYCPPGGIVLDPFSGSGVTAIEAVRTGRLAVAVDINPIAIEILRATLLPVDIDELKAALAEIEARCKDKIEALYLTRCRACRKDIPALAFVWERDSGGEQRIAEVRYKCEHCGDEQPDGCAVDKQDLKLLKKIESEPIPYWYPDYPFKYANGNEFKEGPESGFDRIDLLFTARNLLSCSMIRAVLEELSASETCKELLRLILTSIIHLCTRMCPALSPGKGNHQTAYSSTWTQHRYWIPPRHLEMNCWVKWLSGSSGHQGMLKAKKATDDAFDGIKEAKTPKSLRWGKTMATSMPFIGLAEPWLTAQRTIAKSMLKDSLGMGYADYCFTDPPYDAEIQYGELSALWNAWLRGPGWNWNEYVETLRQWEAVNNPQQGKGFDEFNAGLYQNFRSILDALKPGAYMHLTFHSPAQKVRNATIRSAVHAGFIYEKIHYQPPSVVSAKAMLQPYGSAKGDYIFRFRKPETFGKAMEHVDNGLIRQLRDKGSFAAVVVDTTKKLIAERGEPVPYTFIINHIDPVLNDRGFFLQYHADWNVEDVLANSGEFVMKTITIAGQEGRAWWFADSTEALRTMRIPLTERVERAVLSILKQQGSVEFSDALDKVYIDFPNSFTPDSASVMSVLKEYAEPSKNLWKLSKAELDLENQHSAMIHLAADIGKSMGFEILIGKRESGEAHMGVRLGSLTTSAPDWKPFSKEDQEHLKQVDCVWHQDGKIKYVFEVENTTQFTEAMIRGQALGEEVRRVFVVPHHRRTYIQRRLENQLFAELIARQGWRFLPYEELSSLAVKAADPMRRVGQSELWDRSVIHFELAIGEAAPRTRRRVKPKPEAKLPLED